MSSQPALWRLDGVSSTLLVIEDHDVPRLYWSGSRLAPDVSIDELLSHDDTTLAFAGLDTIVPVSLFPQASTGYTVSPALNGHRNGERFAHRFVTKRISLDVDVLSMELLDEQSCLSVTLTLAIDATSDVATLSTELTNTGKTPYTVDWLAAATIPLPTSYRECLSQHGRWGLENQTHRRHIAPGRIDISNLHGRTSHEHAPSLVCGSNGFAENQGDVLFAHLAWSGNFSLRVERLSDGNISLQAGVLQLAGERILAPGESVTTPSVMFTRATGMNTCTQRFHRYVRHRVLPSWTRTPRPIHANSWEALYFNHDHEALVSLIDAAADVGAERFVLDDGWFRHRRSDNAGLGDWYVDESVYPKGLQPIIDCVRHHGMQFGLWFEPEMVNPDSDLYRAHPEWALRVDGMGTPLARNQLALAISREDVADYLFERITDLVKTYAIDYIKWDQNRDLVLPGDGSSAKASAQPSALYRLLDRILAACPALEIETCASGGARADLAILKHTGRVWTSDNIDPIERARIQQGFLRFMPAEIMGAHVGHKTAHLTGRDTNLHTRAIVALQGQFGFEIDARKLDPNEVTTLNHYTELYKKHRSWLADACYWQLPTYSEALLSSGNVSMDKDRALFSVIAIGNVRATRAGPLALNGLDPDKRYKLSLASFNVADLTPFNKEMPLWCKQTVNTSGDLLMKFGVPLPVMPPHSAVLINCQAIGKSDA